MLFVDSIETLILNTIESFINVFYIIVIYKISIFDYWKNCTLINGKSSLFIYKLSFFLKKHILRFNLLCKECLCIVSGTSIPCRVPIQDIYTHPHVLGLMFQV